jgi:hypothetical protein
MDPPDDGRFAVRPSPSESPLVAAQQTDGGRLDEGSRRAWSEPSTVRSFGDAYPADCDGGARHVSLGPSGRARGESAAEDRCNHVRRVAIAITLDRVPTPSERTVTCAGCARPVGVSAADSPPP